MSKNPETYLQGNFAVGQARGVEEYTWHDQKTNTSKVLRSFAVLVPAGDGTVEKVRISFPNDPSYRAPEIQQGSVMMFPVMVTVNRKKLVNQFTLRTDLPILPAPQVK